MAEWGKSEEHERFLALQEQVRRVKGSGATSAAGLVKDEAWYRAHAEDTTLPAKERAQWLALADELATRLGYNAPPSKQEELPFDETDN
jgi:hypothetical protein